MAAKSKYRDLQTASTALMVYRELLVENTKNDGYIIKHVNDEMRSGDEIINQTMISIR